MVTKKQSHLYFLVSFERRGAILSQNSASGHSNLLGKNEETEEIKMGIRSKFIIIITVLLCM